VSLVELVKPDKSKPARLLRDPSTNNIILEYTGVDGNIYRVPVALLMLPQEFGDLAAQLTLADLIEMIRVKIADSAIIVPVEEQSVYKPAGMTLYSGTVTASGNSGDVDVSTVSALEVELKVTAASGTSPTLAVYIEGKFEATGDYKTLASQTGITGTGIWYFTIDPLIFRYIRVRWVVGGTSPSFTFTVAGQAMV
jgi:putative transposon-encoded protein